MDSVELWDTTMNPEHRNLMKVYIDDDEKVYGIMEDLLNSNAKYADRRKVFLIKNQEKANILE
jgi:DNA gyrase/topoisomerase IV subunit B